MKKVLLTLAAAVSFMTVNAQYDDYKTTDGKTYFYNFDKIVVNEKGDTVTKGIADFSKIEENYGVSSNIQNVIKNGAFNLSPNGNQLGGSNIRFYFKDADGNNTTIDMTNGLGADSLAYRKVAYKFNSSTAGGKMLIILVDADGRTNDGVPYLKKTDGTDSIGATDWSKEELITTNVVAGENKGVLDAKAYIGLSYPGPVRSAFDYSKVAGFYIFFRNSYCDNTGAEANAWTPATCSVTADGSYKGDIAIEYLAFGKDYTIAGISSEEVAALGLSFYPNPAENEVSVSYTSNGKPVSVVLVDGSGNAVASSVNDKINTSGLASGLYFAKVFVGGEYATTSKIAVK